MSERRSDANLLKEFGLVSEESLAKLLGVKVKTLKNRPRDKLPEYVKKGHRRLFVAASVKAFLGLPSE